MRTRIMAIATLLLLATATLTHAQRQNGQTRFEQGRAKETIEGDIPGAIKIYEEIVKNYASSNKALAGKAYVQLAGCYEKLGQEKAQEIYRLLVKDFADQPDIFALAKARLAATSSTLKAIVTPYTHDPWSFAISPDGRRLVFVATENGKTSLWLHELDSEKQAPIQGTESTRYAPAAGGANPFWRPDGQFIGYFEGGQLKTIPVGGGTPKPLASVRANAGGAWNNKGDILYSPDFLGNSPIFRVSESGGNPAAVTHPSRPETVHQYPRFLDDGKQFLFLALTPAVTNSLMVGSLEGLEPRPLPLGGSAAFVPPNHVVYYTNNGLSVRALDRQGMTLSDSSTRLVESVARFPIGGFYQAYSVSTAGPIAYRTSTQVSRSLHWLDRSGREIGPAIKMDGLGGGAPQFSPNGETVAVGVGGQTLMIRVADGEMKRVGVGSPISLWAPSGDSYLTLVAEAGGFALFRVSANGGGPRTLLFRERGSGIGPSDWRGNFILAGGPRGLFAIRVEGGGDPIPLAPPPAQGGRFSPDEKWIAYRSDGVAGRTEVFLQPFPGTPESRLQISTEGGTSPQWSRDGREIYFVSLDRYLMAANVTFPANGQATVSQVERLFRLPDGATYAPAPDGKRFLINAPAGNAPPIYVLSNWASKLTASPKPAR